MAGPLISLFIYSAKGFSAVLGGKQAMIIIISRHNLLSACSSCKTGLQSHPSGEQMASPGSLRLRALLAGVHGRSLSVRTGVSRPKLAGLADGWGRKQRGAHEVANSFLPTLGSPNFITVRSSVVRAPAGHPGHLHTCICASGLMRALGGRGPGASFCFHTGLWVGMSTQGPLCGLDPGGNLAARRPGHLPSHPTVRRLISWLFSSVPT